MKAVSGVRPWNRRKASVLFDVSPSRYPPASTAPAVAQPAAIPMGASYTPLSSGIAMPAGVAPLPGLLGPTNVVAPPLAPEWTPPPPPWVSSGPQLGVIPQRKF